MDTPTRPQWMTDHHFDAVRRESWPRHRSEPHISAEHYHHSRQKELHQALKEKTLIHLDTCHWIKMRNVVMASPQAEPRYAKVLAALRAEVKAGKVLCPCSSLLFFELVKIGDASSRKATAQLVDELSDGICLRPQRAIEQVELKRKFLQAVLGESAPDLAEWIWTKALWVLGEVLPIATAFVESDQNTIKKVFTDIVWHSRISDVVELIPPDSPFPFSPELVEALNGDARGYRTRNASFAEVLQSEKALLLKILMEEDFQRIAKEVWDQFPEESAACVGRIYQQGPDPWMIPSVQILAAIHASFFISSRTMKLEVNDLLDAQHAAIALPYCKCLFVERPLAHRLTTKPLEFDGVYQTAVIHDPEAFLAWLEARAR